MKTINDEIRSSGLKKSYIADRLGITKEHFSRLLKSNDIPDKYKIEILSLLKKPA